MFDIQHVYIIGFGRIGKSIAYTLRSNNFDGDIFACNSKVNDERIKNDININGECDFFNNFERYKDLKNSIIFACVPPLRTTDILQNLIDMFKNNDNIIISDACSVKNSIFSDSDIVNAKNFISIHPMDGGNSEEREFLFKKHILNFVIENKEINKDIYDEYLSFLEKYLNCKNVVVSYKEHDKIVALISHLPNLILSSYHEDDNIKNIMWKEIFKINFKNIQKYFDEFILLFQSNKTKNIGEIFQEMLNKNCINIDKNLQNPSLKKVLSLQEIQKDNNFLSNLQNVYNGLVV